MKKILQLRTFRRAFKAMSMGIITLVLLGLNTSQAQVSFTQTLNADFYKGHYNDMIVSGDAVSLPFQATNVGTWLTTTILPQTLEGHKAATWNNRYVYVVGGYNDVDYSNAVYRATLQSGGISNWTTLGSLPVGLRDHAVVIGTNTIYVLGGRDDSNIFDAIYYAAINTDGSLGAWQTSAVSLPATLWGHTAVYANGYIYVAGGANTMTATAARVNVYYAKVLADNTLSAFAAATNLPQARNGHSMVVQGDIVYVLGGFTTGGTKRNTVYFATSSNSGTLGGWAPATALPISVSNHSSVIINGQISVMAGESGGTLSNSVYYADVTASPLVWNLSTNVLYDRTKDGAAFATNGQLVYCGGENLSGTPIHNTRYAPLSVSANYKMKGFFVSNPFFELGAERVITELTFGSAAPAGTTLQVSYRTAGEDLIWSNWTASTATSPIPVGLTKRYLQYKVIYTSTGVTNATFNDMNLWTPGTELAGNLNAVSAFTLALSPYWVTADISFTSGIHTFNAGVELNFLPETGMTVGQASIICNGTVADSVRFRGFTNEIGTWDGIYFDPNSDNGVSSQFNYTVIQGAGFGSNNANLYCNGTNEPLLMHCNLRGADGNGMRLNGSHVTVEETFFGGNTESGVYLENSNPSFLNCEMSANQFAGIYLTSSASEPNFYTVLSEGNTYAMYYPSPNFTILPPNGNGLTFTGNTYNGICLQEGSVNSSQVWNSISYDYIMLGNLLIGKYGDICRLTIEPGNTVKFLSGKKLQIGYYSGYYHGGELYAIGTADSTINFTSHDGTSGGWEGVFFEDRSDWNGATSVMAHCIVEKGNDYNMLIENTNQPVMLNCTIRDAAVDGIRCSSAYNSIETSSFINNGRYPLYLIDPLTSPTLNGNTWTGNGINLIAHSGGLVNENRTLQNDGIGYYILEDLTIGRYGEVRRLTLEPGLTMYFAQGKQLQVGMYSGYHHGGELYAEGTAGMPITFTPYDGVAGSWNGIFFEDRSDWNGAISSMDYCIVEKGNDYNIYLNSTGSVSITNSTIRDAVTDGLRYAGSYGSFTDNTFENNGRYPVYFMDWNSAPYHENNTFNSKGINYIALAGGSYSENRTILIDNAEYLVLGNILIGRYGEVCRLTIDPGVILNFDTSTYLQVGYYSGYHHGAGLIANGNADSLIVFRPFNGLAGGWDGIFFDDRSDWSSSSSSLKYCQIEKGNNYNMYCENTNQPAVVENCIFEQSLGDGLKLNNASIGPLKNSYFVNNGGNGIYLDGSSNPDIGNDPAYTCNIYLNGLYTVYNNTTNNIDARYNYWGTADSAMIAGTIYDKYDNTSKGIVIFADFAQVPSMPTATTVLSGDVWYHNTAMTAMNNAAMVVTELGGTPVATTATNAAGHYAFAPFVSGTYELAITPSDVVGGVNATDALIVLNHFAKLDTLINIELAAADVNSSASVNGTDALFILKRWAGMITTFPAGDWLYNSAALTVNGNQVINDFEMLCFGDVNSSYVPTDDPGGNVILSYEGTQMISSFGEFDVQITIKDAVEAGAVSFGLYFPEEYMEITGAIMTGAQGSAVVTVMNGLVRIGWADLSALAYNNGDVVFTLSCKAKDLSGLTTPIQLALFEGSEFTDVTAQPFASITLAAPELITLTTSIGENITDGLWLAENYPNPFSQSTTIRYSIPADGYVTLKVMNLLGETIAMPEEGSREAGEYSVEFSAEGLEAGIYLYILEFSNADNTSRIINKMSVTR